MNVDIGELAKLTTTEMLTGMLLFLGERRFSEQDLYAFLNELAKCDATLADRFLILGSPQHRSSKPLRRTLSFLQMGKILDIAPPNPVDQYYSPRASQMGSVQQDLRARGVLPDHEATLKRLADEFKNSLVPATT